MKIIFICDQLGKTADANARIAILLGKTLAGQGHSVSIISLGEEDTQMQEGGILEYWVKDSFYTQINQVYKALSNGKMSLLAVLFRHPLVMLATLIRKITGADYIKAAYQKLIVKVAQQEKPDLFVAFTSPYTIASALADAKIDAQKGIYMLDPYSTHYNLASPRALRKEQKAMQRVDYIALPPLLFREYMKKREFNAFKDKFREADFPLCPEANICHEPNEEKKERILFFFGTFYPEIRSPEFLLNLLNALPPQYTLVLAGAANFTLPSELVGRVKLLPPMAPATLYEECAQADYLVNIDNLVPNQVPSKIFELFSLGKPLINICRRDCAPSFEYIQRYPAALTLYSDEYTPEQAADQVRAFEQNCPLCCLRYADVEKIFYKNAPEYIANHLLTMQEHR